MQKLNNKYDLSQAYLKQIIEYSHETGEFKWAVKFSYKINKGQKAGNIREYHTGKKYLIIIINGAHYRAHHLAWLYVYGYMPVNCIDHLDGDGLNNKLSNLEEKPISENRKNLRLFSSNKSGVSGVVANKKTGRLVSYITSNKKRFYLYRGYDFFEACCARKSAERKHEFHENHGSIRPL